MVLTASLNLRRQIRWAQRVTLAGAGFLLALLAAIGAAMVAGEYRRSAEEVLLEIERSAQKLASRTSEVFDHIDQTMLLIRYVKENEQRHAMPTLGALEKAGLFADSVRVVALADDHGRVVDSSAELGTGSVAAMPGFQRLKQRDEATVDIGLTAANARTGQPEIPVMRRLNRPGGEFGGVVLAMIDPGALTRQNEHTESRDTLTGVVGLDGVLRVRMVDRQLSFGTQLDLAAVAVRTRRLRETLVPVPSGKDGARRFVTNVRVPHYPLLAVVTIDAESALTAYRSSRNQIIGWAVLACALVAAGAALLWWRLREMEQGRSRLHRTEAALRATLEGSVDAIFILQARRNEQGELVDMEIVDTNERAAALLGATRRGVLGRGLCELRPSTLSDGHVRRFEQVMATRRALELELQATSPEQAGRWLHHQMVPLEDGVALITRDVTDRKEAERALCNLARTDSLTQLGNRRDFEQRLDEARARAARTHQPMAVLYVDLDGFKAVNDRYGHAVGDQVLVATAVRLRECVRATDRICRLGGDEFAAVLESAGSADDLAHLCERIVRTLQQPHRLPAGEVVCTPSLGAALMAPGEALDLLLARADRAMYAAKEAGKCGYRIDGLPQAAARTTPAGLLTP